MKRLSFLLAVPLLLPLWDVVGSRFSGGGRSPMSILGQGAPAVPTHGTTEETLATIPIPAGTLSMDGDTIFVTFMGHGANNGDNETVRVRIGGTIVYAATANAANANWMQYTPFVIQRRSATTATSSGSGHYAATGIAAGANVFYQLRAASPITWANANDLIITGETPTQSGDFTLDTYSVWVLRGGPSTGTPIRILGQGAPLKATTGTTEEVLATIPIPAGAVSTSGATVSLVSFYHTANNGNAKKILARVGGIGGGLVFDLGAGIVNADIDLGPVSPLFIQRINATTATAQMRVYSGVEGPGITQAFYYEDKALAVTWANAQDLVITGLTPSAAGDIILDTYMAWLTK